VCRGTVVDQIQRRAACNRSKQLVDRWGREPDSHHRELTGTPGSECCEAACYVPCRPSALITRAPGLRPTGGAHPGGMSVARNDLAAAAATGVREEQLRPAGACAPNRRPMPSCENCCETSRRVSAGTERRVASRTLSLDHLSSAR